MFVKNISNSLIFFLIGCLVSLLAVLYVTPFTSWATLYLLLILIITFTTWLGGFRAGFFLTIFSAFVTLISMNRFEYFSENLLVTVNEMSIFMITAIAIVYVIEKYKKTDLETQFVRTVKAYNKKISILEEQKNKMQEEIRMRDEFLSIASHELKTPLTSMLLKIQLLLHNIRNVSLAKFSVQNLLDMLETAELQTKRLSQMITDLLNVSLITTGRFRLEREKEDVSELVKDVVKEFTEKLDNEKYKLNLDAKSQVVANVDKVRIAQVVSNLLSNAIKYGNGKPIDVSVEGKNGSMQIKVKDKGIGIDKTQKERLFKLFERGVSNKDVKGLGVGLYIANRIIKDHGGKIKVDSKPNKGSTFTVEIPLKNS